MLSATARDLMLNRFASSATWAQLDARGVQLTDRQPLTWAPSDEGSIRNSNRLRFEVPAGTTVLGVSYWSERSGGICYGSELLLDGPQGYRAAGEFLFDEGSIREDLRT